jgi:hypothetical protein
MSKFAERTTVSSSGSRVEIEKTLSRYGANKFMYGWQEESAVIAFEMEGRRIKFILKLPSHSDDEICKTEQGRKRSDKQQEAAYEQSVRQKWRALALVIKAKLEAVESGITVFEDEFMAHIVLPDGTTVGDYMRPQIASSYENKKMPALLPGVSK